MAEDDPISLPANVRALAEQMPNAHIFSVPDGGHFMFGHTEEVRAEVARFLGSLASDPQMQPPGGFAPILEERQL
jgi:pimeloyl-ACP methyl ester carboxylesterase